LYRVNGAYEFLKLLRAAYRPRMTRGHLMELPRTVVVVVVSTFVKRTISKISH